MKTLRYQVVLLAGLHLTVSAAAASDEDGKKKDEEKSAWAAVAEERQEVERFARDYMTFLDGARSELQAVSLSAERAREQGLHAWKDGLALPPGTGIYAINRDRAIIVARAGRRPLDDGLRVIATHIDSPRLDVKARPLYEKNGLALLQTIPHGGIKYYQWGNVPLALIGHFDRTDGRRVPISVGLDPSEPVLLIPDLAPHEDKPRRERTSTEVLNGEELDPLVGSIPGDDGVREQLLTLLMDRYDVSADDFVSAELALVPAIRPREVGLDGGLIVAYGQDDKLCSYAALRAVLDERQPEYWTVAYLADNEESGSGNNTGARSEFLKTLVGSWLEANGGFDEMRLRRILARSLVASADVTTGINPMDPSVHEETNASRMNGGVVIKRYGRGTDGNSETLARIRGLLDSEALPWQTHTYKVDVGGGGTLGGFLSVLGMEVFDVGVPVLSMHSPAEVSSKADVYILYRFLRAFAAGRG